MRLNPVTISPMLTNRADLSLGTQPVGKMGNISAIQRDEFKFCGDNNPPEKSKVGAERKEERAFLVVMASGAVFMMAGAIAGSWFPIVGTLLGSLCGGSLGLLLGASYKGNKKETVSAAKKQNS